MKLQLYLLFYIEAKLKDHTMKQHKVMVHNKTFLVLRELQLYQNGEGYTTGTQTVQNGEGYRGVFWFWH
jgi:hypothetical protein